MLIKKVSNESIFVFWIFIKTFWNLNKLKCELKSVYDGDFAKQASSIQDVADIIEELG